MHVSPTQIEWVSLLPELILVTTAFIVLLAEPFLPRGKTHRIAGVAFIGTVAATITVAVLAARVSSVPGEAWQSFGTMFVVDAYALVVKAVVFAAAIGVVLVGNQYTERFIADHGEYYFLLLGVLIGSGLVASARDLTMLVVAVETVTVPGFVLVALRKERPWSNEAAMKYFLTGVVSFAVMIFGVALVYGYTASTDLATIAQISAGLGDRPLYVVGVVFVLAGFMFKVAVVPFHFWAPDVYQGSPAPIAALLSVVSKTAGVAGLIQITMVAFNPVAEVWAPIVGALAVTTMTLGNLAALRQQSLIRLLAYSSVANGGFIVAALGVAVTSDAVNRTNDDVTAAMLVYVVLYVIATLGAFGIATATANANGQRGEIIEVDQFAGFGRRHPFASVAMTLFMLSLAGIPPVGGWYAKYAVVAAVIAPQTHTGVVLGIAIIVNTIIAVAYYLRVVQRIWLADHEGDADHVGVPLLIYGVLAFGVVALGVFPGILVGIIDAAVNAIGG